MKLTLEEIAKAVEGRLIGDNAVVTAVSTDTRTISEFFQAEDGIRDRE